MHERSSRLVVRHKIWLDARGQFALGDGGIDLLRAVATTGSIRAAAAEVGWSYRHALAYLDNAERVTGADLVERARGGQERGGTRLTRAGRHLVRRYSRFRREVDRAIRTLSGTAFIGPRP